jgi:hypothetical protein
MPNGGHISCSYCIHDQRGQCGVYGVETTPDILCRMFRTEPAQPYEDAAGRWPVLDDLKPGIVYSIDNDAFSAGNPKPLYVLRRVKRD